MCIGDHSRRLIEEMIRYYEAHAPWHDECLSYESIESTEALLEPVIRSLETTIAGKHILEIACGTGNWTQVLAKRALSVTAIDSSPKALEIAEEKLADHTNVVLSQCDAYDLSEIKGSFDVLFASDWWSHMPIGALPFFLETAIGKLKADSKAVFLDMFSREHFEKEPCYYDSDNNRVSRRRVPDGSEYDVVKNFPDKAELERILSPYARRVDYYEFDDLYRWMVVFAPK
jgi:demethylmenaquinone methyltransferase/2-methoxy-6-polyprenyl-1,4-benzoquinol methylase